MKQLPPAPTPNQKELERAYNALANEFPDTPEYKTILERIETLQKIEASAKETKRTVSPDTIVMAGVSILGIIIVLAYEHVHPIAGKAFGMLPKLRF